MATLNSTSNDSVNNNLASDDSINNNSASDDSINNNSASESNLNKKLSDFEIEKLLLETVDDKDIISLNDFWIFEDNVKKIVYPKENYHQLRFYYENHDDKINKLLRCFEIDTLSEFKKKKIDKHPISLKIIPSFIFNDSAICILNTDLIPIEKLISDVFKLFSYINLDENLFINLNKTNLIKVYNELNLLWIHNIPENIRNELSNIELNKRNLENNNLEDIQRLFLNQMKILLEYNGDYKLMMQEIIIAAFGYVIPEFRSEYHYDDLVDND